MNKLRLFLVLVIGIAIGAIGISVTTPERGIRNAFALKSPSFKIPTSSLISQTAGISAWYQLGGSVDLNQVKSSLHNLTVQRPDYLYGDLSIPGYDEADNVNVYINADGSVLVYYFNSIPVGRLLDVNGMNNVSKLNTALALVASASGYPTPIPNYYHFRYPGATGMFIASKVTPYGYIGYKSFDLYLPDELDYYDISYGYHSGDGCCLCSGGSFANFSVNGSEIFGNGCNQATSYANMLPGIFRSGQLNTIALDSRYNPVYVGIIVLYGGTNQPQPTDAFYSEINPLSLDNQVNTDINSLPLMPLTQSSGFAQDNDLAEQPFKVQPVSVLYLPFVR